MNNIYKVFVKESKNSGHSEVFENMEDVLINIKSFSEFEEIKIAPQIEGHEIKTTEGVGMKTAKKVIYYYYDCEGNRRPLSIGTLDSYLLADLESRLDLFKKKSPDLDNLFVQIDGVEFKLL